MTLLLTQDDVRQLNEALTAFKALAPKDLVISGLTFTATRCSADQHGLVAQDPRRGWTAS